MIPVHIKALGGMTVTTWTSFYPRIPETYLIVRNDDA